MQIDAQFLLNPPSIFAIGHDPERDDSMEGFLKRINVINEGEALAEQLLVISMSSVNIQQKTYVGFVSTINQSPISAMPLTENILYQGYTDENADSCLITNASTMMNNALFEHNNASGGVLPKQIIIMRHEVQDDIPWVLLNENAAIRCAINQVYESVNLNLPHVDFIYLTTDHNQPGVFHILRVLNQEPQTPNEDSYEEQEVLFSYLCIVEDDSLPLIVMEPITVMYEQYALGD